MVEAEITCECPAIQLADLQMALTRGMVVYLAENRARVSKDLQRAVRARGVTVKYVQRFREQRPAPSATTPQPGAIAALPPVADKLDPESLAQRIAEIVTSRVLDALNQGLAYRVEGNFPDMTDSSDRMMGSYPSREIKIPIPDDIPVFIPSKIGRDDLQPAEVKATAGEAGSVLDAAAALKAARKGRGK